MKTAFRSRRPRIAPQQHQEQVQEKPFFSKQQDRTTSDSTKPFFNKTNPIQTKASPLEGTRGLTIGQPGDVYEREADSVADSVVNQSNKTPVIQQKKISAIQRLATPAEEEKMGTNEERMEADKAVQTKQEEEEPVQMQAAPEEEEPIQKMDTPKEEEQPIQKADAPQEEKEPVQMQAAPEEQEPIQKMDAPKEEEEPAPAVQPKSNGTTNTASSHLSSRIESSKGKGSPLPDNTRSEMESSFGTDFSDVKVHNDPEATQMNRELSAHAFTTGKDIYFNQGKYSPESSEGKRLLAHELTHTVQQGGGSNPKIQRQCSTRIPGFHEAPLVINGRALYWENPEDAERFIRRQRNPNLNCYVTRTGGGRRYQIYTLRDTIFSLAEIQRMQRFLIQNASGGSPIPCINTVRAGIGSLLYNNPNISGPSCPSPLRTTSQNTMEETMDRMRGSGISRDSTTISTMGDRTSITTINGRRTRQITRVVIRRGDALVPVALQRSAWATIMSIIGGTQGWSVFGISICDGYHSALITVNHTNLSNVLMYWSDQTHNHPVHRGDRIGGVSGSQFGWERMTQRGTLTSSPRGLDPYLVYALSTFSNGGRNCYPIVRLWRITRPR